MKYMRWAAMAAVAGLLPFGACTQSPLVGLPEGMPDKQPVDAEPEPEPVPRAPLIVGLSVAEIDQAPEPVDVQSRSLVRSATTDGSLGAPDLVREGQTFRLWVTFTGRRPSSGSCNISLTDSAEHTMRSVTARATDFVTPRITVVDDDDVTTERSVTASLTGCTGLGVEAVTINSAGATVTVIVEDYDPDWTPSGGPDPDYAPPSKMAEASSWCGQQMADGFPDADPSIDGQPCGCATGWDGTAHIMYQLPPVPEWHKPGAVLKQMSCRVP